MRKSVEDDRLETGNVEHFDQRLDVVLVDVPEFARLLLGRVKRVHVDVGGAVTKDEALVRGHVGRLGRGRIVFVVGWLDKDRLEVFDLVVQRGPEAVVDVAAPAFFHHQPSEAVLKALYTVVGFDSCAMLLGRPWDLGLPARTASLCTCAVLSFPLAVGRLLLVALDLGVQTGDDALQAAQSLQQLGIGWLSALSRRASRSREDAVDFGAHAVGTRVLFVAFDLAPTAGNARPGVWRRPSTSTG